MPNFDSSSVDSTFEFENLAAEIYPLSSECQQDFLDSEQGQIKISQVSNRFIKAPILEQLYRRKRLKQTTWLLRIVSLLLIACFSVDCIYLNYRNPDFSPSFLYVTVALCAVLCSLLALFLFRNRIVSYLFDGYYQNITTLLALVGFIYVVISEASTACYVFNASTHECRSIAFQSTSTRTPYELSILFVCLPFCYRMGFLSCLWLFSSTVLGYSGFHLYVSLLVGEFDGWALETLFQVTIVICMLLGIYLFERNDRIIFLRMEHYNQIRHELRQVREELTWREDEANTNEMKLEIEKAKSSLDELVPGAKKELEPFIIPFDRLAIDKLVGRGSCGEVFRGRLQENTPIMDNNLFIESTLNNSSHSRLCISQIESIVAVKRIPKHDINEKSVLSTLQETLLISRCKHPNVLELIGLLYDPYVCLVFEYMHLGSLKELLDETNPVHRPDHNSRRLQGSGISGFPSESHMLGEQQLQIDERRALVDKFCFKNGQRCWTPTKTRMCIDIAAGVSYLHSIKIIHRDLKSSNLMINSTHQVKIADFGTARMIDGIHCVGSSNLAKRQAMSCVGSPLWIAPEIIGSEGNYDDKCDVWSFGVILCEMISNRDPYTNSSGKSFFNLCDVVDGALNPVDFILEDIQGIPPTLLGLAKDCCKYAPSERCSMKDALFRLLEIVVQQEISQIEIESNDRPYIRYSRHTSSRGVIGRRLSNSHESSELSDKITISEEARAATEELKRISAASNVDSVGTLDYESSGDDVNCDIENQRTNGRPLVYCQSTITMNDLLKQNRPISSYPVMSSMGSILNRGPS